MTDPQNKSIRIVAATLILSTASSLALASCPKDSASIFSCVTTNGKQIQVCDSGKSISYSFGKAGAKPELDLVVARELATTYQWQGMGRWVSYSINIPNGIRVYSVFWSYDRQTEEHEIEAGVSVLVDGNSASRILCKRDSADQSLEGLDLKATEW